MSDQQSSPDEQRPNPYRYIPEGDALNRHTQLAQFRNTPVDVPTDTNEAWFQEMDRKDEEHRLKSELSEQLYDVQRRLSAFLRNPYNRERAIMELDVRGLPQQILDDFAVDSTGDLLEKLQEANLQDEQQHEPFVGFLRWHNQVRAAEEEELAQDWLPNHISRTTERVEAAVQDGHLPPAVLEKQRRYADHPELYHVWVRDVFEEIITGPAHAIRLHDGRGYIGLGSPQDQLDPTNPTVTRDAVATHENAHLWIGRPNRGQEEAETPDEVVLPTETSLHRIFPGEGVMAMEEAVITQLGDALIHGHFEDTDPESPHRANAMSYHGCRELMDALPVSFYEIVEAAISDDPAVADRLAQKIDDALPGIRQRVADLPMLSSGLSVSDETDKAAGQLASEIKA
jgi:hypothetical protein